MIVPYGLSAFPLTPANAQGRVNATEFRRCITRLVQAQVDSIGILGSTGTHVYLSREARCRALDIALEEAGSNIPVIAGIGALLTRDVVQHARDAKAAGATAGLLPLVSYIPLTEEEAFAHFTTAAACSELPIIIYDNPNTTHFRCSATLIERLANAPGIVGIKNITPEPLAQQRRTLPKTFSVGISGDRHAAEALIGQADTWYSVLGGLFPVRCQNIMNMIREGHANTAREISASLAPIWSLFKQHSGLRVVHTMANVLGIATEPLPAPLLPLSAQATQEVEEVMQRYQEGVLC